MKKSSANINSQYMEYISKANTRYAEQKKLRIPKHKTAKFQRSPLYRTITSWNTQPTFDFGNINQQKTLLQKQTDRHRQTQTDTDRHRQTQTDTDRHRQTQT